jgi:hypothetical protein
VVVVDEDASEIRAVAGYDASYPDDDRTGRLEDMEVGAVEDIRRTARIE